MSSDGVEKPIDIKIIDPAALTREERDLAKFKRLAEDAEKIEKRLRSAKGGLVSGAGAPIQQAGGGFVPSATGASFPGGKVPAGALAAGVAPASRDNAFLKLRDKVALLEQSDNDQSLFIEDLSSKIGEVTSALRNPGDFLLNAITQLGGKNLTKALGAIGAVVLLATVIFNIIKKNFQPGGVLDIRKIIKDEAATIPNLDTMVAVRAGRIVYSGDTRVGQRIVQNSSTENLSLQSQRFNELVLGSDLSG
jgi:hypothetical protein